MDFDLAGPLQTSSSSSSSPPKLCLAAFHHCATSPEEGHVYDITVLDAGRTLEVQRHYRDFFWLDSCIATGTNLSKLKLPKKAWFGLRRAFAPVSWDDNELQGLRKYMEHLFEQVRSVEDVECLREFFGPSQVLQHAHCSFAYQDALTVVRKASRHQAGHVNSVNYMAMSCCMKMIVSASEDTTCRVWGLQGHRWQCLQVLEGHTAGVDGVAIASDLSLIATSSEDTTVRLWSNPHWVGWRCEHVLTGHTAAVRFVAIACGRSFIVSVSDDMTVRLWRSIDKVWSCHALLQGHTDAVYGVSIASCGVFFATGSNDTTVRVWHEVDRQWKCKQVLTGHEDGVYSVVIAKCGFVMATTSGDCTCRLWDQRSGCFECMQVLAGHNAAVYDVAISCELHLIATGDETGACHVWLKDGDQFRRRQVLRGHNQTIYGVQIAKNCPGDEIVIGTGSQDQTSIIWRFDGKQAYKSTHVRPAYDYEVTIQICNLVIYFMQKCAMAFSPSRFGNQGAMKAIKTTLSITILCVDLDLPPQSQFLLMTLLALAAALLFLACALTSRCRALVFCLSTFLLTPVLRRFFLVFDCHDGHLEVLPEEECYTGFHLYLSVPVVLVGLPYLLLVAGPFTAAAGDLSMMPPYVWLRPSEWVRRRQDKISGLDLGLVSPSHRGGVLYAYTNVITRIALLAISVFLDKDLKWNSLLSLVVLSISLILFAIQRPMEHDFANVLIAAGQVFCLTAFLSCALAGFIEAHEALVMEGILVVGWGGTVAFLIIWFWLRSPRPQREVRPSSSRLVCG